jgi:hypothetical protein
LEKIVDPYIPFSKQDLDWFDEQLRARVPEHPDDIINVLRHRGGLDLELSFVVAPRSRHIFTEAVCLELTEAVKQRTGALAPVIYVEGDPHPAAKEALNYM